MSPIIEGADLTKVSTERETYPEGEYICEIIGQEMDIGKKNLIIKHEIESSPEGAHDGKQYWNYVNVVQNDGKPNEIGWQTIKRYMEALVGKEAANVSNPDTDQLNGQRVGLFLTVRAYKDKETGEDKTANRAKRIWKP